MIVPMFITFILIYFCNIALVIFIAYILDINKDKKKYKDFFNNDDFIALYWLFSPLSILYTFFICLYMLYVNYTYKEHITIDDFDIPPYISKYDVVDDTSVNTYLMMLLVNLSQLYSLLTLKKYSNISNTTTYANIVNDISSYINMICDTNEVDLFKNYNNDVDVYLSKNDFINTIESFKTRIDDSIISLDKK